VILRLCKPVNWLFEDYTRNILFSTIMLNTKLSQICAYADDIVIIARTQKKLIEVNLDLGEETSKLGMEINEKKTIYVVTSTYGH
jgi:hypothetical protein